MEAKGRGKARQKALMARSHRRRRGRIKPREQHPAMHGSLPLAVMKDEGWYWGCPPAPQNEATQQEARLGRSRR